jgi:hypothetical protein
MGLRWNGDAVQRLIEAAAAKGVGDAADLIADESQRRVPEMTGELKRSQGVHKDGLHAVVHYGDNKAAAAHENLTVNYRRRRNPGARAKFLESAANDKSGEVRDAVADAIRRVL